MDVNDIGHNLSLWLSKWVYQLLIIFWSAEEPHIQLTQNTMDKL